jgi:hypothetical protein
MRGDWSLIRIMCAGNEGMFVGGMADIGGKQAVGRGQR